MARKLCTEELIRKNTAETNRLEAYTACRLIPLDKNPGVRPIGIGETIGNESSGNLFYRLSVTMLLNQREVSNCVQDNLVGARRQCMQLIKSLTKKTQMLYWVDASNTFISINREAMLHNIRYICAPLAKYLHNCYLLPSRLFITVGREIASLESTTQGDPHAMSVYAVGITPLLPIHSNAS